MMIALVVLPFLTALALVLMQGTWRRVAVMASCLAQCGVAFSLFQLVHTEGTQALALGSWGAWSGIVLVADSLTAGMAVVTSLVALACCMPYRSSWVEHPLRLPLMQILIAGAYFAYITGDLFNLFVAFEILVISSFALLTLDLDNRQISSAPPYVTLNFLASLLFLTGCGLCYGFFGTLNFALLSQVTPQHPLESSILLTILLFAFLLKAGVFPLFYWMPNAYPNLPAPVVALFAGLLTKIGVYASMRVLGTALPMPAEVFYHVLFWVGAVSAIFGGLAAFSAKRISFILTYHIISQIGLMIMALGAQSAMAWAGCILLLWHNMIVKPALFIAGDEARQIYGTDDVRSMGGLIKLAPLIAMVFFLQAMSLAGIPPLSGFWGKLVLFMQGAKLGHLALIFATILGGFLTLMSMLKIWIAVFWGEPTTSTTQGQFKTTPASVTFLVIALLMGLGAYYFSQSAVDAAESVKDFLSYYQAVIELPVKGARL